MQMPNEDGSETAGPTFEYVAPERSRKQAQSTGEATLSKRTIDIGEITMSINRSNDENIPTDTEAYYEELASQENCYLPGMPKSSICNNISAGSA
jgi:hypothetical protein